MPLKRTDKEKIIAEITEIASDSIAGVVAHYRGLNMKALSELRLKARESNVYIKVYRNTSARRALADTRFVCLNDALVGPVILAFSKDDPGAPARIFREFAKENKQLAVQALAVDGQFVEAVNIDSVADLPTYDEGVASLMRVMIAPVTKLVQTLNEVNVQLVRTVSAIAEKKKSS